MACASLLTDENILRFRTKACLRLVQGSCSFGDDRCQYSHSQVWTRRSPYYASPSARQDRPDVTHREPLLRYLPVPCENLVIDKGKVVKVKCPRGVNCPFSHSPEEIAYHPLVYKTEPCKAFSQRSCRVYYCWKSHGEKERRQTARNISLGIVKGLEVPVSYPGANLVELVPNKNGRRRRPRVAPASPASISDDDSCNAVPLKSTPNEEASPLLHRLVGHLADHPEHNSGLRIFDSEWIIKNSHPAKISTQQDCDDLRSNWPPLTSLLRLLSAQRDLHSCPQEGRVSRGSASHGLEGRANMKNRSQQACRQESRRFTGGCLSLDDALDDIPLKKRPDFPGNGEPLGTTHMQLTGQFDAGGSATRCLKPRGRGASEPVGSSCLRAAETVHRSYPQQCGSSSHLNLFTGFGELLSEDDNHAGEALGDCSTIPTYQWSKSGGAWDGSCGPLPIEEAEPRNCSVASWSTPSSGKSSMSGALRPSVSTRASQASSADMRLSFCEHEQLSFENLKAFTPDHDKIPNVGRAGGEAGSLTSTCLSPEFPSGGNNWNCVRQELGYLISHRLGGEEPPPSQIQKDKASTDQWKRSWPAECSISGPHKDVQENESTPHCLKDLHGGALGNGNEANSEADDNRRLMTCFVSLLKIIQDKEASDTGSVERELEGASIKAASHACETTWPTDETTDAYFPQIMALWNMARLAHPPPPPSSDNFQ